MKHIHLPTQHPCTLPTPLLFDGLLNEAPVWGDYHAAGYRHLTAEPTPDGYRIAGYTQSSDPDYAEPVFEPIPPTPEPTPEPFPHGIETPVVVIPSANTGTPAYGIVVDSLGRLATYEDHASPRPDAATIARRQADALEGLDGVVDALAGMKAGMKDNVDALQALDATPFTGDQRVQFRALKQAAVDVAQSVNLLRRTLLRFYKVEEAE